MSLPDALQQQVIRWRAEAFKPEDGRPVAAANLHLTLAFLGEVSAQKELALKTQAGRITQAGFSLNLDDLGHWPRPRSGMVGQQTPPTRAVTAGGIAAFASGPQRLLSKPDAVSSPYHVITRRDPAGRYSSWHAGLAVQRQPFLSPTNRRLNRAVPATTN
ncbi:2'-5'-RNA ligase [Serratia fonticola]|uniref:2'-5'-RNA ligase n=1 Tax=Serratia fonticola TaxID=47917 RepID=A0A4U9WCI3_SERFO|nr:2'-5'-RNA ligase [Serratia fonticola]